MRGPIILTVLLMAAFYGAPSWGYSLTDRSMIPRQSDLLLQFSPLAGKITLYAPSQYEEVSDGVWEFQFAKGSRVTAFLREGENFRNFDQFILGIFNPDAQLRINGPIAFPDKFDDMSERYFVHFIHEGRMLTGIYGSVIDPRKNIRLNIEFIFPTDLLDYFDPLTCAILCNVKTPEITCPKGLGVYPKCVMVYECNALRVPLGQNTPEEAVSAYYATLITNRWCRARSYIHPSINVGPPPYNVLYKERAWWAVKWFKILYSRIYQDKVECVVIKGVRQGGEEQEGVDCVDVKKHKEQWYVASFEQ